MSLRHHPHGSLTEHPKGSKAQREEESISVWSAVGKLKRSEVAVESADTLTLKNPNPLFSVWSAVGKLKRSEVAVESELGDGERIMLNRS